jgi:hypothetical protein
VADEGLKKKPRGLGKSWGNHGKPWKNTGWWFQTFFIFNNIWDNPSH